jgi:hypothetical protein
MARNPVARNSLVGYLNFAQILNIIFLIFIFILEDEIIVFWNCPHLYISSEIFKFLTNSNSSFFKFQTLKLWTCLNSRHSPRFVKFIKYQLQQYFFVFQDRQFSEAGYIFLKFALFPDIIIYFMSSLMRKMKDKHFWYLIFRICITNMRIFSICNF